MKERMGGKQKEGTQRPRKKQTGKKKAGSLTLKT